MILVFDISCLVKAQKGARSAKNKMEPYKRIKAPGTGPELSLLEPVSEQTNVGIPCHDGHKETNTVDVPTIYQHSTFFSNRSR